MVNHAFTLAYLDPGTGSFFLQMLLGGILGSMFAMKQIWRKMKGALWTSSAPQEK